MIGGLAGDQDLTLELSEIRRLIERDDVQTRGHVGL